MIAGHEKEPDDSDFLEHVTEVMAGFCLACLLTLAFLSPLSGPGRAAAVGFAVALPLFVAERVAIQAFRVGRLPGRSLVLFNNLGNGSIPISLLAFVCLLWQVWWLAGLVFIVAVFALLGVLLFSLWWEGRRRTRSPDSQ